MKGLILTLSILLFSCSNSSEPEIKPKSGECYRTTEYTGYIEIIISIGYNNYYITSDQNGEVFDIDLARFVVYPKTRLVECPSELFFRKKVVERYIDNETWYFVDEQILNSGKFKVTLEK